MPETPKHNHPVAFQPRTNEAERSSKVTFFSLPTEIRLQIYNLLLVSRFDPTRDPSSAASRGKTNQKKITCKVLDLNTRDEDSDYSDVFDMSGCWQDLRDRRDRTIEPAILQTCKKIYHEANPILYSQNVFAIEKTEETFQFIRQIGFVNFKLIKKLEIWVPSRAKLSPWLGLLYLLATEASGLRCIRLCWDSNLQYWGRGAWDEKRGLGDNLLFVHALGKIQGLEELVIEGYYAKNWLSYLEERMGVQVQAIYGWYYTKEGILEKEGKYTTNYAREHNEMQLELFTEYQQGTDALSNIMPETPKHNRPVASQPCTNEAERSSKVTFFSLPTEIRLQIYNLLLVSRFDGGETNQKKITCEVPDTDDGSGDDGSGDRRDRTIEPALLQTCKKIYHEANPILYSQNVFVIKHLTEDTFQFIRQIGFVNFKLIKKLEIWVPSWAKLSPWLGLLYLLATEASGLRCIRLCWDSNLRDRCWWIQRGAWDKKRGLGDNLLFVRALGKIQGLEELVIEGYYAKNWPSYLEERMDVRVQAICGWYYTKKKKGEYVTNCARKHNEMQLELFTEYQQGTENLIP
ncbi:hypothetical protein V8E54_000147 [Elaphomyces granulatus]